MKSKTTKKIALTPNQDVNNVEQSKDNSGISQSVLLANIDVSPFNYRQKFNQQTIQELAEDMARNGMISPMMVRPMPGDRYEQVTGGRRYMAAQIAQLDTVPVIIRELTDQQVRQIQLAENMQRENPHPLDEARGIAMLQEDGKSIDDIAARIGKSKAFVYSRIKLAQLIDPFQQIFISDRITTQDALEIAALSAESQQEFFNDYCKDWEDKNFQLGNVRFLVTHYKYDLKQAPFDIKDKKLIADVGACGGCPFNSATLKSLFPEMSKEAKCTNAGCFKNKCLAHFEKSIRKAVTEVQPAAVLIMGNISEETRIILDSLPETAGLPQYRRNEITMFFAPRIPDKEHYTDSWQIEEDEEPEFNKEAYDYAVQEYETDLAEYNSKLSGDEVPKGLLIDNTKFSIIPFTLGQTTGSNSEAKPVTSKEVQEAIKAGTATPELLTAEIERINKREKRAKELDREKVQLTLHEQFKAAIPELQNTRTAADNIAARLIIYQSLDYSTKNGIDKLLFGDKVDFYSLTKEQKYEALAAMTDEQECLLIRTAVISKFESKMPGNVNALCLYKVAESAGFNVAAIEEAQAAKATERTDKLELRIKELEMKIAKLELKTAA